MVLGLPYPYILHPGLILTVTLRNAQCLSILRAALSERRAAVAKTSHPSSNKVVEQRPMILACLAQSSSGNTEISDQADSMGSLYPWGCAGRVLRLINMPHTDQCRILLSGISRIHVEKVRPAKIEAIAGINITPPPVATVKVLNDKVSNATLLASPAHERLKAVTIRLIDIMHGAS